jgi:hypothetical protein
LAAIALAFYTVQETLIKSPMLALLGAHAAMSCRSELSVFALVGMMWRIFGYHFSTKLGFLVQGDCTVLVF